MTEIKLSLSAMRKINFIFKVKEQKEILKEASFYKSIYYDVNDNILLEAVINKHIKTKIYKIVFMDNKKDIKEFNEYLKKYLEEDENLNNDNDKLRKYLNS